MGPTLVCLNLAFFLLTREIATERSRHETPSTGQKVDENSRIHESSSSLSFLTPVEAERNYIFRLPFMRYEERVTSSDRGSSS